MKKLIFYAGKDLTGLVIRITLGLVLFPHGAQKTMGWFGGYGFSGTMNYFTATLHLPGLIAFLIILIESLGALALIAGFAVRLWALALILLFTGIIATTHWANGFFMNWSGSQPGEGFEYHLLVIGLALALLLNGAGRWSADRQLAS